MRFIDSIWLGPPSKSSCDLWVLKVLYQICKINITLLFITFILYCVMEFSRVDWWYRSLTITTHSFFFWVNEGWCIKNTILRRLFASPRSLTSIFSECEIWVYHLHLTYDSIKETFVITQYLVVLRLVRLNYFVEVSIFELLWIAFFENVN